MMWPAYIAWRVIDHAGSISSICGLVLCIHIYVRELKMARDVRNLKREEEQWHEWRK
jgi:hypothetical protein